MDIVLQRMDILIILTLPFHEHGISFYLLVSFSFSSSTSESVQCAGLRSPWLNLLLGILFFLMQLQTDFLSLSDGLLLVFRNAVDFCVLIW